MELEYDRDRRQFRFTRPKERSKLDRMALSASKALTSASIDHVFVSGYVAILFGRNRSSEDIDLLCAPTPFEEFSRFWDELQAKFECIITDDKRRAYEDYLLRQSAIRFAYPGEFIPNIELKFAYSDLHHRALHKKVDVVFANGMRLPISPLELQIAYKLFLGSNKDIEDARFLFKLFAEMLDTQLLVGLLNTFEVTIERAQHYLGWVE